MENLQHVRAIPLPPSCTAVCCGVCADSGPQTTVVGWGRVDDGRVLYMTNSFTNNDVFIMCLRFVTRKPNASVQRHNDQRTLLNLLDRNH